ncbi:MAG: hypothetical protein II670_08550, partial [Alphaproteobacteria bacterium]|nr:hypothetical protein [Alphaproteobacteria bacterium]
KGIESKFDGRGNYTLGIQEQIIFPEINIDTVDRILPSDDKWTITQRFNAFCY